jgi:uncharacterized protein YcnI
LLHDHDMTAAHSGAQPPIATSTRLGSIAVPLSLAAVLGGLTVSVRRVMRPCSAVAGLLVVVAALVISAPTAWAHVTVHPETLPAGTSDVEITFRVPNERDSANTVGLQVFFPSSVPLLTVEVLPVPGWVETVHTRSLSTPIQTDDGPVSQVVSDVRWTATAGGIAPGQYEDFPVAVGAVPDHAGTYPFKALQSYSSGEVVRWIEIPMTGQPEPDSPAPELTLTAPSATGSGATEHDSSAGGSGTDALSIVALVLSGLSLTGVGWLLWRGRRRA